MTFVAGQVLTAAQLNALDITSLTVDTDTLVVDATNDRVGINTASPSVALDVGGSVVIDDDLTVDTSTLKVDSTNNRVGIGTASPGQTLALAGDMEITGNDRSIVFTGTSGPHGFEVNSGTMEAALYYRTGPNSWSFEDGSGTKIAEFDTDDAKTTFGGAVNVSDGQLHVERTAQSEVVRLQNHNAENQGPYISLFDLNSRVGYLGFPNNDDLHVKNETSAGRIYLSTNNTTRMTVHQNGNVGIGITTAPGKLQVLSQNRAVSVLDSGVTNYAELGMTNSGSDAPALGYISAYGIVTRTGTSRGGLADRYTIASNGYHYINSAFPGVSGYYTVRRRNSDGLLGYASSSQRYKENIVDADDTWRQIYNLRPRDFDWRESMFDGDPTGVPDNRSDYGLIAEEANLVMPSIVQWSTPPDETDPVIETIDYEKLSTYFLPAIQDLNARVATLESA